MCMYVRALVYKCGPNALIGYLRNNAYKYYSHFVIRFPPIVFLSLITSAGGISDIVHNCD